MRWRERTREPARRESRPTFVIRASSFVIALLLPAITYHLSTPAAHAQGAAFTYQGRLDDNGSPAGGIYDLRFAIYDAGSGGTQQGGALTNVATAVSNGLFTVALDFGNQFPGADRWLEIGVVTNGGGAFHTLSPRQKITATPYAVRAANFSGPVDASQLTGAIAADNIGAGSISSTMLAAGAVTTGALADGAVTPGKVATASQWVTLTIANPTPAINDNFGHSVAALGSDWMLIGGTGAGAVYLFSTSGTLLATLNNPTPGNDFFGFAMSGLGGDRVLVGAYQDDTGAANAGAAYLFSANGALLTTFTNPTPATDDWFGFSVAAVGSDRVLIGAYPEDTVALDAGAAYLFSTNGTFVMSFTNPSPSGSDWFGYSVAALGSDRVLISAAGDSTGGPVAGVAYLFSTSGALLTTFTNPTPGLVDFFGNSVAALGTDRVLIGALGDDTGADNAGAVYLFSTNGTLLTTFTNPAPAIDDFFGNSVAALESDRVLIGTSRDNTGASDSGAAYLFSTNGTLLMTFANPTPAVDDQFGISVAALGSDRVLIGAFQDDTGAVNTGTAYLFSTELFADGLVADAVRAGSVTTASIVDGAITTSKLADGAVTASKLDATIGVWTASGGNVYRSAGGVGIGTSSPDVSLHIRTANPVMLLEDTDIASQQSGYIGFWNNTATPETAWVGFGTPGSPHFSIVNARPGGDIILSSFSGGVGISREPIANKLEVEGNASKTAAGSWLANSDARIKTGVETVKGALDKLAQVRLVEFHYTDDYRAQHPSLRDRSYLNVVAQEFQKVFPEHVQSSGEKLPGGGDPILQVDTYPLTIYSAAAIQELNRKVEQKEAEITELKSRLEKLERLVSQKSGGAK